MNDEPYSLSVPLSHDQSVEAAAPPAHLGNGASVMVGIQFLLEALVDCTEALTPCPVPMFRLDRAVGVSVSKGRGQKGILAR